MKSIKITLFAAALAGALCSCSNDSDKLDLVAGQNEDLAPAVADFVNKTVVPTYHDLATEAIELAQICAEMKEASTTAELQSLIDRAGVKWKEARTHWELSEAFLYGAAADYNIDPHIDSWPLDYDQLDRTLRTPTMMDKLDQNDDDAIASLGYSLLGFHAIEYMLFADGAPRAAATLTPQMLVYTAAVARDLRNQTILLEASWSPAGISAERAQILEDADLTPSANYGSYMLMAGQPGSIYRSNLAAMQQIVQGCVDIADEVANTKIFTAYSSSDVDYIESPHSKNSQKDFADNIRSIRNVYCGSNPGDASVSQYIRVSNPTLDAEIRDAIEAAIADIEAARAPFVDNINDQSWGKAHNSVNHLADLLGEALNEL